MYYCIYKFYCKFFGSNPLLFTYKLPFAEKYFAWRGYDPTVKYMEAMNNPRNGIATIFAMIWVGAAIAFYLCGFLFFFCGIFEINLNFK